MPRAEGGAARARSQLRIRVALGPRRYDVILADDFAGLAAALAPLRLGRRAFILTDRHVASLHARALVTVLRRAGFVASLLVIPAGEREKSLQRLGRVLDRMVVAGLERGDTLFACGGGVIGDLGGFAAATYLRGIGFVQVPTTLLAMVDSSVGGKVGVNLRRGKNLAGAFHQPRLVYAPFSTLATLPARELRSGLAEIIKAGMIGDRGLIAHLEWSIEDVLHLAPAALREAVARAVRLKARVVAADEREAGIRAILNYGHTVGHAIEVATGYRRFRHGEAIALGMVAAGRLALELGVADPEVVARQDLLIARAGLPLAARDLPARAVLAALTRDKKVRGGKLRFVLVPRVGAAGLITAPPPALVSRAVAGLALG
jgi:3-dehydroquinate synthase